MTLGRRRVLLDCGLFQGLKDLRLRNWREPAFAPAALDAVVLSHAHIDHTGALPLLVKRGFGGHAYCTPATADLLAVMLPDSGHLQEEDAERANRGGYTRHHPALPLYTREDAVRALARLVPRPFDQPFPVAEGMTARFRRAGHILGSATVDLTLGDRVPLHLVFSGDLGRWHRRLIRDPDLVAAADVLLVESTYGDRVHETPATDELARIVTRAAARWWSRPSPWAEPRS